MRRLGVGYQENDKRKIACAFSEELFEKIRKLAEKEGKSFSKQVEELCRIGIFDLEESDKFEPKSKDQNDGN